MFFLGHRHYMMLPLLLFVLNHGYWTTSGIIPLLFGKVLMIKANLLLGPPIALGAFVIGQGTGLLIGKLLGIRWLINRWLKLKGLDNKIQAIHAGWHHRHPPDHYDYHYPFQHTNHHDVTDYLEHYHHQDAPYAKGASSAYDTPHHHDYLMESGSPYHHQLHYPTYGALYGATSYDGPSQHGAPYGATSYDGHAHFVAPNGATSYNGPSQHGAPYGATSYDGHAHFGAPYGATSYDGPSQHGAPYGATSYDGPSQHGTPYGATSYDGHPHYGAPSGATSYDSHAHYDAPYGATVYDGRAHNGVPYRTTSYDGRAQYGAPYATTSYDGRAQYGAPYGTTSYDGRAHYGAPYGAPSYDGLAQYASSYVDGDSYRSRPQYGAHVQPKSPNVKSTSYSYGSGEYTPTTTYTMGPKSQVNLKSYPLYPEFLAAMKASPVKIPQYVPNQSVDAGTFNYSDEYTDSDVAEDEIEEVKKKRKVPTAPAKVTPAEDYILKHFYQGSDKESKMSEEKKLDMLAGLLQQQFHSELLTDPAQPEPEVTSSSTTTSTENPKKIKVLVKKKPKQKEVSIMSPSSDVIADTDAGDVMPESFMSWLLDSKPSITQEYPEMNLHLLSRRTRSAPAPKTQQSPKEVSDTEVDTVAKEFVQDIKNLFSIVSFLDINRCLEKMVCEIHSGESSREVTEYERNIITAFSIMDKIMPIEAEALDDSTVKYRQAAHLGQKLNSNTEICSELFASCGFSTKQIIHLGNIAVPNPFSQNGAAIKAKTERVEKSSRNPEEMDANAGA